jgi:hypothetical protein
MAYLIFVMEREAIEPVYGADLSLDFCYLEAGYMEELLQLSLQDIVQQRGTSTTIKGIPVPSQPSNSPLHKELGLSESQVPVHVLVLSQ